MLSPSLAHAAVCTVHVGDLDFGAVDVRACVDNAGYACTSGSAGGNNECRENNNQMSASATQACAPIN